MKRPLFTSFVSACCSLGILTLAQCGGSSSDAEGLAPSSIANKTLSMQVAGIADSDIQIPPILEITTGENGAFSAQTQGTQVDMWNGTGIYTYAKTGKDTASLTLAYNKNDGSAELPATRMSTIKIDTLTFDNATHASSGEGGASISYMNAEDRQPTPLDGLTISVNIMPQV